MLKKIILLLFICLFSNKDLIAQDLTKSQIINIISKQSMLIERMAKAKITKSNDPNDSKSEFEIVSSIILFEKNIKFLEQKKYTKTFKSKVIGLKLLWAGYKKTILGTDENTYVDILRYNEIILNECNLLYDELLGVSFNSKTYPFNSKKEGFADAVVNNNDLKYLSQRLSLYYSAYYFRVSKYDNKKFTNIIEEIDLKLSYASSFRDIGSDVISKIEDLENEWTNTKQLLEQVLNNKFISTHTSPQPALIFNNCNNILKKSDQLSRAYKASQSSS